MTDFETARANMVESQIRPNGVTDVRIIAAMATIPRELFVPQDRHAVAYMDEDLTVATTADGSRRALIEPMALARLLQLAAIRSGDLILDIGCASGYSTAILAELGQSVIGLEADMALAERAGQVLGDLGVGNAAVITGEHAAGYPAEAPYDVIFLAGCVDRVPAALIEQLKQGGRLVCVTGTRQSGRATIVSKSEDGAVATRYAFNATVAEIPGFAAPEQGFVF